MLKGLKIRRDEVYITMLHFADDTMFMCKANTKNIVTIKSIMKCFEMTSELKVNLHKSYFNKVC